MLFNNTYLKLYLECTLSRAYISEKTKFYSVVVSKLF